MTSDVPYAEVIGDPISHSKSPLIHNFWLTKLGLPYTYKATQVVVAELPTYINSRKADPLWRGCNVTMPLKIEVLPFIEDQERSVRETGAVNCVIPGPSLSTPDYLVGANTDVWGISATLQLRKPKGRVMLIGNGGAARAALYALKKQQYDDVCLVARDKRRGDQLLKEFGYSPSAVSFEEARLNEQFEVLINASPLGMARQPAMPVTILRSLSKMRPGSLVFDMVYHPVDTALVQAGQMAEMWVIDGLNMLVEQARDSFDRFFGARPLYLDAELRALLIA